MELRERASKLSLQRNTEWLKSQQYMGSLQGKAVQLKRKWVASADDTVEASASFIGRNLSWWNRTILDGITSHPSRSEPYHILVTAHGGVIGTMVRNLIQAGQVKCAPGVVIRQACANTSVAIIDVDQDRLGTVTKYGDVSHMGDGGGIETNADEVEVTGKS